MYRTHRIWPADCPPSWRGDSLLEVEDASVLPSAPPVAVKEREPSERSPTRRVSPKESSSQAQPVFGRYWLLEPVGEGAYAKVYKAWDPELQRRVAIKVLGREDGRALRRFAREVVTAARLRHPHIVSVFDCGRSPQGAPYLVMDYVEGRTLWALTRRGELDLEQIARIVRDVAKAIHYAHQEGVLHRDIKPENILVTAKGAQAYVLDFGLARNEWSGSPSLTGTGDFLGTPMFMAPEQARGKGVDSRSDIYALGATLYCALTGKPPGMDARTLKELFKMREQPPVPPSSKVPGLPPWLDAICLRCLHPRPEMRYATAAALAADLEAFLRESEGSASIEPAPPVTVTSPRPGLRAWLAALTSRLASLWQWTQKKWVAWEKRRQAPLHSRLGLRKSSRARRSSRPAKSV